MGIHGNGQVVQAVLAAALGVIVVRGTAGELVLPGGVSPDQRYEVVAVGKLFDAAEGGASRFLPDGGGLSDHDYLTSVVIRDRKSGSVIHSLPVAAGKTSLCDLANPRERLTSQTLSDSDGSQRPLPAAQSHSPVDSSGTQYWCTWSPDSQRVAYCHPAAPDRFSTVVCTLADSGRVTQSTVALPHSLTDEDRYYSEVLDDYQTTRSSSPNMKGPLWSERVTSSVLPLRWSDPRMLRMHVIATQGDLSPEKQTRHLAEYDVTVSDEKPGGITMGAVNVMWDPVTDARGAGDLDEEPLQTSPDGRYEMVILDGFCDRHDRAWSSSRDNKTSCIVVGGSSCPDVSHSGARAGVREKKTGRILVSCPRGEYRWSPDCRYMADFFHAGRREDYTILVCLAYPDLAARVELPDPPPRAVSGHGGRAYYSLFPQSWSNSKTLNMRSVLLVDDAEDRGESNDERTGGGYAIQYVVRIREGADHAPRLEIADVRNAPDFSAKGVMETAKFEYEEADRKLNEIYKKVLGGLKGTRRDELIRSERAWLVSRDAQCRGVTTDTKSDDWYKCVREATEARTEELRRVPNRGQFSIIAPPG